MLDLEFDKLVIKKQSRRIARDKQIKHLSYDTETVNGQCVLLVNSKGESVYVEDFADIIHFMCRDKYRSHIGFFYNLKYDFQAILKWLEPEHWEAIHQKGRTIVSFYDPKRRREIFLEITYIPRKFLKFKIKGKTTLSWKFYDIAQYYGKMKLDNAGKKYLGIGKVDISAKFDIKNVTHEYCKDPEFVGYALQDALITDRLASLFISACTKMGLSGGNFSSPASLSSDYFQQKISIPTINTFLKRRSTYELLRYPWNCISGAFISVFQRGYFDSVFVYDINSSYPTRIAKLPDLTKGKFYMDTGHPCNDYHSGWMHVRVNIDVDDMGAYHPCIPMKRRNASNYYPIGRMETWITLSEYKYFSRYHDIEVIDGLYWTPTILRYPFAEEIPRLYKLRKETDDVMINAFLKIVLNGLFGKFLQKIPDQDPDSETYKMWKAGNLFNPFYASYILADSRIAVHQLLMQIPNDEIVACFTDSVICKKELDITTSGDLGDWGFEKSGDAVVLGCGIYTVRESNGKVKTKLRGFNNSRIDLFRVIEEQPDDNTLTVDSLLNISPSTALIQKRYDEMNLLINTPKTININFDTKRCWQGKWDKASEILTKEPIKSVPYLNLKEVSNE